MADYNVAIQEGAVAGDIIVVGIYGTSAVGATPSGWSVVANVGTLLALYSHTVVGGEAGTFIPFTLGSGNHIASFSLHVRGSSGVTGRASVSAGAVGSLVFTTSASAAPLIVAGCFSILSQRFGSIGGVSASVAQTNVAGIGTHCPSVVFAPTTANTLHTFNAARASAQVAFELDFAGVSPAIYCTQTHTEGDIPAQSPAFVQQNTVTGSAVASITFSSKTLAAGEDCLVVNAGWENTATVTASLSDPTSANPGTTGTPGAANNWTEVTGLPVYTGNGHAYFDLWYITGHGSGAVVPKVTFSGTVTTGEASWASFSGVATASAADGQNSLASQVTTTGQTGTIATTNASDVLCGAVFENASSSVTNTDYGATDGSVNSLTQTAPGAFVLNSIYQIVAATGTYGFQVATTGTQNAAGGIIALKALVLGVLPRALRANRHKMPPLVRYQRSIVHSRLWRRALAPLPASPAILRHHPKRRPTVKVKQTVRHIFQLRRLIQPPASALGFAESRIARRHRLLPNPRFKFQKDTLRIPRRLIQPPAAALGFAVVRIAKRHKLTLAKPFKRIKDTFRLPRRLIQPPAAALGVALREIVRERHPVGLSKRWKIIKSSFKLPNKLQPPASALGIAVTRLATNRPLKTARNPPLKRDEQEIQRHAVAPGVRMLRMRKVAARLARRQPLHPLSQIARRTVTPVAIVFMRHARRRIAKKAKALAKFRAAAIISQPVIVSGFKVAIHRGRAAARRQAVKRPTVHIPEQIAQPPVAALGFAVSRIARRHRQALARPSKFIKDTFRAPRRLIQPPASALGAALREIVRKPHPIGLGKAWKTVKSSFRAPRRLIQPPLSALGVAQREIVRRLRPLSFSRAFRLVRVRTRRPVLAQPPAANLGFPPRAVEHRQFRGQRFVRGFKTIKSAFKRVPWLVQPPASALGFPPRKLADRHRLVLRAPSRLIKSILRSPRRLILLPAAALGVALREIVQKPHPVRLSKPWRAIKSTFRKVWLTQPPSAALGFPPSKLTDRHRLRLRPASKLIKSAFRAPRRLIQPPAAALGFVLREVARKGRPIGLGKRWKTVKSSFRIARLQPAALVALIAFVPTYMRRAHRLVLRKSSKLIKSSFKKIWLAQPPAAALGFAVTRIAKRHRLVLMRVPKMVKDTLRIPQRLIQPPAAKLGFAVVRVAKRHRLVLTKPFKQIKDTFRLPQRIIQPPVAKLGFAVTRIVKRHKLLFTKPFRQIKDTFRLPQRIIQPPAAKLGVPATKLRRAHRLSLQRVARLPKSLFKKPQRLQPPAQVTGFIKVPHPARRLKAAARRIGRQRLRTLVAPAAVAFRFARHRRVIQRKPVAKPRSQRRVAQPVGAALVRRYRAIRKIQRRPINRTRLPARIIQPPAAALGVALRELTHHPRVKPALRRVAALRHRLQPFGQPRVAAWLRIRPSARRPAVATARKRQRRPRLPIPQMLVMFLRARLRRRPRPIRWVAYRWRRIRWFPKPPIPDSSPRVIIAATLDADVALRASLDQQITTADALDALILTASTEDSVVVIQATLDRTVIFNARLGE